MHNREHVIGPFVTIRNHIINLKKIDHIYIEDDIDDKGNSYHEDSYDIWFIFEDPLNTVISYTNKEERDKDFTALSLTISTYHIDMA
jgi:hypothetical protein